MMRSVLLGAFALSACQIGDPPGRRSEGDRVFDPVSFDTLWSLGEESDSTFAFLWSPVAAPGGGLYVADLGNVQLHHVSSAGELVWSYGRQGQGPGELLEVRVFDVDSQGNVVIVDNLNRRIVTVGRDGNLLHERPLPQEVAYTAAVAVLDNGNLAIAYLGGPWALLSKDGQLLDRIQVPWEGFREKHFLELVGQAIPVRGTDRWVYSFDAAGEWIVFDGSEAMGRYPHIEHVPFSNVIVSNSERGAQARYEGRPIHTTADLAVRKDTLFVVFFGTTENRGRLMDKYDINTGDYIGSVLFPRRTTGVTFGDDGTVFAVSDSRLFHTISALRYKGDAP